ncbi:RE2 [Symbiodinium sp. CCMP2592]|nr:RE2 [Symbiodinium sp. CCMP2592]
MRMKVMKVSDNDVGKEQGTLLDSGSTHVLRPARDERERDDCHQVCVTLAGDEQRLLSQTGSGSIIVEGDKAKDVQSIIPFGKVIECLGCTLKWSKGGFYHHHPKHGRIKTHVRGGCPEITDAGQAAAIIAELEMKKVAELREKTHELQSQLTAIQMLEDRRADWRILLAKYAEEGCSADGLQALYTSPVFATMPSEVRARVAPELDVAPGAGWNYLKLLPLPRRMRKRLHKSSCWVLNMFAGEKKGDPVQALSGATSSKHRGAVVVINVDVTLSLGWNLQGEIYKALLWGAMNSKVKAVIASPPTSGLALAGNGTSEGDLRYLKDTEMIAKELFLYLVSYTASEGAEPAFAMGAPTEGNAFWKSEMIKKFQDVVGEIGVNGCEFEQGAFGHPERGFDVLYKKAFKLRGSVTERNKHGNFTSSEIMYRFGEIDAHGSGYRYFLAASYTKPRFPDLEPPPEDSPEDLADLEDDFSTLEVQEKEDSGGLADDEFSIQGGVFDEDELAEYEPSEVDVDEDPAMKKVGGTNGLWDDDDFAAVEQEKDAKATEDEEGNVEVPTDFLYYFKPLKGKSGKHVLKAIQEKSYNFVRSQRRYDNGPSTTISSLRGPSTFSTTIIWTWTPALGYSDGYSSSPPKGRPSAARGTQCSIKKKYYGQGGKLDLLPRWVKGTYMGPVWDVNQGSAILEDETNRFTVSTHVRAKLVDPGTIDQEPELKVEPPPRRRLTTKTSVDKDGVKLQALSAKEAGEARKKLQGEIAEMLKNADFIGGVNRPQLQDQEHNAESSYVTLGAYQHGGVVGVTNATKDNVTLAEKVCKLVTLAFPEEVFSSVTIVRDTFMPLHRDCFNDRKTYNLVIPLEVTDDAAVWEELCPGDLFLGNYKTQNYKGRELPGQLHSLKGDVKVKPHRLHCAVQPSSGTRLLLAAHTVGGWKKLKGEDLQFLGGVGFQMPDKADEEYMIKRAQLQEHKEALHLPWVIEDEDVVHDFGEKDSPAEVDEDVIRCAKAAADNLYTYSIEEILSSLQDELRVVHTVHPREVDQNLPSWIPALKAEMKTLEDIGAIKRLVGQAAKDYLNLPGVQVVPGKAVYTVKPPNKPEAKYRRKARIVGRGNFQAKDDSEQNYSRGAASEAVRLGVAQAARRVWAICTGDVVSAFLRAPVPQGTLLALRPPAVLVRAGLAQPSEVWSVHMVRDAGGCVVGLVIIYVDDFFIAAPKEICGDIYKWLAETWETTPIQFASSTTPIRFLGIEVREARNEAGDFEGYTLDQEGYLQEVLRHRNVRAEEKSLLPATKETLSLSSEHDPPTYPAEDLKLAQSITGELAWMAQRCRPDLAYVVSIMASLTTRDPVRVAAIGRKTLAYLNHTSSWRLRFWTGGTPTLVTYTDSSYAPDGDRSHGGAVTFWGTCPIAWRSSRQQLVTTSSAETELVAAHHGCQQMESIDALLTDMGEVPTQRIIYVDNAAAITLATSEGGSWKTRHLKSRIEQGWVDVVYCPGDQQLADGLTKLLPSQRMNLLMEFWGLTAGLNRGDQARLRQVQAPAEQAPAEQAPAEHSPAEHSPAEQLLEEHHAPTVPHTNPEGGLGCCLGLVVVLMNLVKASGEAINPEVQAPLAVDSSLELYGAVVMLGICAIAVWECARVCWRNRGEVARLRMTQENQRLSKKEMRELNSLLRQKSASLTSKERDRMIQLADATGVDLSGILAGSPAAKATASTSRPSAVFGGASSPPPPPDPYSACAADEEFLRERRQARQQQRMPASATTYLRGYRRGGRKKAELVVCNHVDIRASVD